MLRPFSSRERGLFVSVDGPPHGLILRRRRLCAAPWRVKHNRLGDLGRPRTHHCIMMK
jgi:hypothetical protein